MHGCVKQMYDLFLTKIFKDLSKKMLNLKVTNFPIFYTVTNTFLRGSDANFDISGIEVLTIS